MRVTLHVSPREPMSKGQVRRMRAEGRVPVTLSAHGQETRQLTAPTRELTEFLYRHGTSTLVAFEGLDEPEILAIARQVQKSPVGHRVLHVGFMRVSGGEPITATVRLAIHGEPEAVRTGTAVLEQQADALEVRALPDDLPASIAVDVSQLEVGGVYHVGDLPAHPQYEIMSSPETVIASVHTVRAAVAAEEEEQAAEEEGATPAAPAAAE